jgi:hypothetical protein
VIWFLLGVVIAALGGLALIAAVRVAFSILGGALRLVFGIISIFDHKD